MAVPLTVLHIFCCLVLILVILLQAGRGQGLTGPSFASGNVQSLLGTRAADFLTKATSVIAICFLFTCLGLDYLELRKSRSLLETARPQAPVDIQALKKALEKVKAGETQPAAPPAASSPAEGVVKEPAPNASTSTSTSTKSTKAGADIPSSPHADTGPAKT